MKKKSVIFGRRHLVMGALALLLAGAVYLNWQLGGDNTVATSSLSDLGNAQFVNAQADESAYFTAARAERKAARNDSIAELKEIAESTTADEDTKKAAAERSVALAAAADAEASIETLVKAKGFKECIAVIGQEGISIVVRSEDLLDSQVMQIKDIVTSQTDYEGDEIKIMNVN